MKKKILQSLPGDYPWQNQIHWLDTVDSTNTYLRELAHKGALHGTAVAAGRQTFGRGRMGRSFHSPEGMGIYLSILLRPDCAPGELMHLTCAAAVAMCDAVEQVSGVRPGIKWTNDLVFGNRKLAGILTELVLDPQGRLAGAVIGVGINCSQKPEDFPEDIRQMAASLEQLTGKPVNRAALAAAMLEGFANMNASLLTDREHILNRYRKDCVTLGKEISLHRGEEIRHGKALDVDSQGALVVEFSDGHTEAVSSGEISIRGMYGYL